MNLDFAEVDDVVKEVLGIDKNRKIGIRAKTNDFASAPLDIAGFSVWSGREMHLGTMPIRTGVTDLESLRLSVLPARKEDRLEMASAYYDSDDFLGGILDLKKDFALLGFTLAFSMSRSEEARIMMMDEAALENEMLDSLVEQAGLDDLLEDITLEWNLASVVADLFLRLFITDSFILYWRKESGTRPGKETLPGVWQIMSLNPRHCIWYNDQGQDELNYRLPRPLLERIREAVNQWSAPRKKELIDQLLAEGIPASWIEAVAKGSEVVPLRRDEGFDWIVHTNGPEQEGLAWPTMYRIFLYLESRRALRDGDFTTSYMMKHFIQHVTLGETNSSTGFQANQRTTWAQPNEIEAMHDIIIQGVRASRLVTNHTVKINYVFPPKEMFDGAKYKKPEDMILHWSHMQQVMLTGGGTTNSSGYLGVKSLGAHLSSARERVVEVMKKFFRKLKKDKLIQSVPDKYIITCSFDQNALKEQRQIVDELKFFIDINSMSPETAIRETGRDSARVLLDKRRANIIHRKTGQYAPIVLRASQSSQSQDDLTDDKGGRPPNDSTTPNEDTRTQPAVAD